MKETKEAAIVAMHAAQAAERLAITPPELIALEADLACIAVLKRIPDLEEQIWELKMRLAQKHFDETVGDRCPEVKLDIASREVVLEHPLSFEGGKAQIKPSDYSLMEQIVLTIKTLFDTLTFFEWPMVHVQFDGHVQPTGDDDKCELISYFRAAELVDKCRGGGTPKKFMHTYGYGGTRATPDKSKNRRVEIRLLQDSEVPKCKAQSRALWSKITNTYFKVRVLSSSFTHPLLPSLLIF
jgi:outer membrane protein OmpA-like peptidoglycan-associated protein